MRNRAGTSNINRRKYIKKVSSTQSTPQQSQNPSEKIVPASKTVSSAGIVVAAPGAAERAAGKEPESTNLIGGEIKVDEDGRMDLSDIEKCDNKIILPRDPFYPQHFCNAVVSIGREYSNKLWNRWLETRSIDMDNQKYKLDGQWSEMFWLRDQIKQASYWDDLLPNKIVSYKVQCKRGVPDKKNSIVYFHGNPKQHDLLDRDWVKNNWV